MSDKCWYSAAVFGVLASVLVLVTGLVVGVVGVFETTVVQNGITGGLLGVWMLTLLLVNKDCDEV